MLIGARTWEFVDKLTGWALAVRKLLVTPSLPLGAIEERAEPDIFFELRQKYFERLHRVRLPALREIKFYSCFSFLLRQAEIIDQSGSEGLSALGAIRLRSDYDTLSADLPVIRFPELLGNEGPQSRLEWVKSPFRTKDF